MKDISKYIKDGINISKNPDNTYTVFTPATKHFKIRSIDELTQDLFEEVISSLKNKKLETWNSETRKDNPHHHSNRLD